MITYNVPTTCEDVAPRISKAAWTINRGAIMSIFTAPCMSRRSFLNEGAAMMGGLAIAGAVPTPTAFAAPSPLRLEGHPEFDAKWLARHIGRNPGALGLGNGLLNLGEREDPDGYDNISHLVLAAPFSPFRYYVGVRLFADSHLMISTITAWDIARRRTSSEVPVVVVVAERFSANDLQAIANTIAGNLPLIAIQVSAYQAGERVTFAYSNIFGNPERELEKARTVAAKVARHRMEACRHAQI